jgi:hypothetical protein
MKISHIAFLFLGWTSTSVAFTFAPRHGVVYRASLVDTRQLQVALSDPNVVANAEEMEDAEELLPIPEPPLTTEEVVAAIGSDKKKEKNCMSGTFPSPQRKHKSVNCLKMPTFHSLTCPCPPTHIVSTKKLDCHIVKGLPLSPWTMKSSWKRVSTP